MDSRRKRVTDPGQGVCPAGGCFGDPQTGKNGFFSPVSFPSVSCHPLLGGAISPFSTIHLTTMGNTVVRLKLYSFFSFFNTPSTFCRSEQVPQSSDDPRDFCKDLGFLLPWTWVFT